MHTPLKNKVTLVTGVSSGIGREIAQLLAERGARVFGTVRDPKSAQPTLGVEIVRMEVTDDSSVNEAVQTIVQKAGPIQHLVNNAGYAASGCAWKKRVSTEARQQFETNFFGVLRVTNAMLPGMRQAGLWSNRQHQFGGGFSSRAVYGNLCREQTRGGRIHRDVGS